MPADRVLSPRYEKLIEELVASGRFRSPADVVAAGLNLLEAEIETASNDHLKALIREGIDSGPGIPADEVLPDCVANTPLCLAAALEPPHRFLAAR